MIDLTKEEFLEVQRAQLERTIDQFGKKFTPEQREKMIAEFTKLHEFQWEWSHGKNKKDDER